MYTIMLTQKRRTGKIKKKLISIPGRKTQNGGEQKKPRPTEEVQREDGGREEDAGPGATGCPRKAAVQWAPSALRSLFPKKQKKELHFTVCVSLHQVKELEQILKSRNPNSLPALIYAVANADKQNEAPSSINALLERRIQHLEAELEGHEEEAKRSIQAMEQQFQRIKVTSTFVAWSDRSCRILVSN